MSKKSNRIPNHIKDKVMNLDCRKDENIRRLEKSLMRLPIIKNKEMLETDKLDLLIKRIEGKYKLSLGYIMRNKVEGKQIYTGMIKNKKHEHIGTTYGITMWEVLAKTVFFMFYYISEERVKDNE